MSELSTKAMEFIEDLKSCSREEALQKLATIRNLRTVAKPQKPKGVATSRAVKLAAEVGDDFLKKLQTEGLL